MKKSFLFVYFLLLCGFLLFVFSNDDENLAKVYFFDVGQGDSALIRTEKGQNILIDGGPDEKVVSELSAVLSVFDLQIDLLVLTHPHSDHVTGLNEVLDRFVVKSVAYSGALHTSPIFLLWLEKIKQKDIPLRIIEHSQKIFLSEKSSLEFLYPTKSLLNQRVENLNNSSLVARFVHGDSAVLFMGDAEVEIEKLLLQSKLGLTAQILKLGHHGSDTSSSENFLQAVSPDYAIVSAGQDNDFGHPSLRVVRRLERMGVQVLETSKEGRVEFLLGEDSLGRSR